MQKKVIAFIAEQIARHNRATTTNGIDGYEAMRADAREHIAALITAFLPHGSGFDAGTTIDIEAATDSTIRFGVDFHHMNEGGFYDGWSSHEVIAYARFDGFDLRVTGRNRNDIKEYISDVFHHALNANVESTYDRESRKFRYRLVADDEAEEQRAADLLARAERVRIVATYDDDYALRK